YNDSTMSIEYHGTKQTIPITCTQKLDPKQFVSIDPQDELELESDDEESETLRFYNAVIENDQFTIADQSYPLGYMDYCEFQQQEEIKTVGPGKCLCQWLKAGKSCEMYNVILDDYGMYTAIEADPINQKVIHIREGKDVPIGKINRQQVSTLEKLLRQNQDLFAKDMSELQQT